MHNQISATTTTFGDLLKRLRGRAGMTQDDLAAATGYSRSLIAALERNLRLPDVEVVIQAYIPALGLQQEPRLAAQLVELAALARGERVPSLVDFGHQHRMPVVQDQTDDAAARCLPIPPAEILGRDAEIRRLCDRLLGHQGRLLTLVGPPGVGKTRLALAVAIELQRFYRDGACFVTLAPLSDPALAAPTLVSALGLDSTAKAPEARLIEHLRRKELLLVLDNFEQLLTESSPAVALVSDLLAECPGLRLLITSRERLHVRAEQRNAVQPLAPVAAAELFAQRAAAVDAGFVLTDALRPLVGAICEQVDRLPLAIELCAAQIDLLSLSDLLAGLQARRLDLLVGGPRDLPPHQRTLRRAIAHSYGLLDAEERALFRSLGIFVGGCELAELEVVSGWAEPPRGCDLAQTLHALVGKSLVQVEATPGGGTRYLLLETIREFALEQARAAGEEAALRERHFAAYLRLFREGDPGLRGPEAARWLARLEPEQDNLRGALKWSLDVGRYPDMAWLLLAVGWFWIQTGRLREAGGWMEQALSHSETLDAEVHLAVLLHRWAPAWAAGDLRLATRCAEKAWPLLEVCPDDVLHSAAWEHTGNSSADFREASAAYERSIAHARAAYQKSRLRPEFALLTDLDFVLGFSLRSYASLLIEHGEFARAAPLLAESSRIYRARGSRFEEADTLGMLGRLALLQGDIPNAHALLLEAATIARAVKYQQLLGIAESFLGLASLYLEDVREARRLLEECLRIFLDLNSKPALARVCAYLARLALWEGRVEEAGQWLARSFGYDADPRREGISHIERLLVAARLAAAQGAYPRAAMLAGLAERLCSSLDYELAGPERQLVDAARATTRAALGDATYAEAFRAGRQLTLEEAFSTILAPGAITPSYSAPPHG